ncbi:MAG TPA: anti-sigma regulatory factor [Polyangiaceae bacterium]|jgi:serine/threonine-protein kinase RsbT
MAAEELIPIAHERDIVSARQRGRQLASECGFSTRDQTLIATAISEVARNIVAYAREGHIVLEPIEKPDGRRGISVAAIDRGPGIADVELAMRDGYSTGKSLGLGLPGARRLMDEFEIETAMGKGTTIRMRKWMP